MDRGVPCDHAGIPGAGAGVGAGGPGCRWSSHGGSHWAVHRGGVASRTGWWRRGNPITAPLSGPVLLLDLDHRAVGLAHGHPEHRPVGGRTVAHQRQVPVERDGYRLHRAGEHDAAEDLDVLGEEQREVASPRIADPVVVRHLLAGADGALGTRSGVRLLAAQPLQFVEQQVGLIVGRPLVVAGLDTPYGRRSGTLMSLQVQTDLRKRPIK